MRNGELKSLRLKNTGLAVTTDVGEAKDIHPKDKQSVGSRLALWALAKNYGQKDLVYSGPLYKSAKVEGDKIRIQFKHVGAGLATKHGDGLQGFAVAGKDGKYHWAKAEIDGDSVVVSSSEVLQPVSVQYAWDKNSPWANLFNKDGLPALTFRAGD